MTIAGHPPHRSGRAQLTHPAPTSSIWRENAHVGKGGVYSLTAISL